MEFYYKFPQNKLLNEIVEEMSKKKKISAPTIQNRKARHNYTIEDELEAGIVLYGTEVKSLREGRANLNDAFAIEKNGEIWLNSAYIAEYSHGNRQNHKDRRPRKLLLHAREIRKLIGRLNKDGVTLVPLSLYFNSKGYVKVKLGIAKGKKKYDKRESEKQRDWQRDKARLMKNNG